MINKITGTIELSQIDTENSLFKQTRKARIKNCNNINEDLQQGKAVPSAVELFGLGIPRDLAGASHGSGRVGGYAGSCLNWQASSICTESAYAPKAWARPLEDSRSYRHNRADGLTIGPDGNLYISGTDANVEFISRHLALLEQESSQTRHPADYSQVVKMLMSPGLIAFTLALGFALSNYSHRSRPAPLALSPTPGLSQALNPAAALQNFKTLDPVTVATPPPKPTLVSSPRRSPQAPGVPSSLAPARQKTPRPVSGNRPMAPVPSTSPASVPEPPLAAPVQELAAETTILTSAAPPQRLSATICSAVQAQLHQAESEAQRSLLQTIVARGQCP